MAVRKYYSALLGQETWGYDARIKGRRVRKIGFASKENAELALSKRRVTANEKRAGIIPQAPAVTIKRLVEARIKQLGTKLYSRRHSAQVLRWWLNTLPDGLTVEELTTAHISRYRDSRLEKVKPQTVFREITDVCSCLSLAHELFPELAEWRAPKRPKLKIPKGWRTVTITPEQAARLLEKLRRPKGAGEQRREYRARLDAADFFEIALQTLGRKSEIRTLAWAHVYWQARRLQLDSKKTDEEGVIYISDALIELLKRRREAQNPPSPWVFPSDVDPRRPLSRFRVEIIRRAAAALGIPWGYALPNGIVLHTTRHTAVTALLEAGYDIATVQAQSRHSTRQMLMRYGHARPSVRRATAETLSAFASKTTTDSTPTSPDSAEGPARGVRKMAVKSKG